MNGIRGIANIDNGMLSLNTTQFGFSTTPNVRFINSLNTSEGVRIIAKNLVDNNLQTQRFHVTPRLLILQQSLSLRNILRNQLPGGNELQRRSFQKCTTLIHGARH